MERNQSVDFSKGILIFGVIWGHIITALSADVFDQPIWIHQFFRIYDLPMFMIISGYYLKTSFDRHSVHEIIINKLCMLLIPIIFWNLIRGYTTFHGFYFLWAILISSFICILGHSLFRRIHFYCELIYYLIIVVMLHLVEIPFNLFYLFPFFCFGYYLKNLTFRVSQRNYLILLLLFVIGLCFWKPYFTPWKCGFHAWYQNHHILFIYVYRFLLGISGVYILFRTFNILYSSLPKNCTEFVLQAGQETLALYILQFFFIETILYKLIRYLPISVVYSSHGNLTHHLIGYIIAPLTAIATIFVSLYIIQFLKSKKQTKWVFGFRYK